MHMSDRGLYPALSIPAAGSLRTRHRHVARGLVAVCRCERPHPRCRSACRRGTKVPAPSCGFAGAAPGETVMAKLINELLLLTCMGVFIASAT
jgi:hypothetical protein